ncbi:hypothetical protein B0H21DRAFT_820395 [Amylocystis lapponica]|nr:hypothetical protein B0H21DRAFT_820395 [Amylocystis lapponica]
MFPIFEFKMDKESGILKEGRLYYPSLPSITTSRTWPTGMEPYYQMSLKADVVYGYWFDTRHVADFRRYSTSQSYQKAMFLGSWIIDWMEEGHERLAFGAQTLKNERQRYSDALDNLSAGKVAALLAEMRRAYYDLVALDTYETRMLEDLRCRLSLEQPGKVLFEAIELCIKERWEAWRSHTRELFGAEFCYNFVYDPMDPDDAGWDVSGQTPVWTEVSDSEIVQVWLQHSLQ